MMTLSGRHITRSSGFPRVADIALGLSRMNRFGGQTNVEWTVAHHSLVMARLVAFDDDPEIALHVLLHDAHECLTGDIPTTFKTPDMRELQHTLDRRIYMGLNVPMPAPLQQYRIAGLDKVALLAEAYCVAPAPTYEKIADENEMDADHDAIVTVQSVIVDYQTPDAARFGYEKALRHELLLQARGNV